ncbi:MAG: peptidoglycan editing factor PgeF [Pyrinomonadaceae bacterium]|nr:peptidoglycan editing factor PgeF [Pyrinomonadaceae bacterium]
MITTEPELERAGFRWRTRDGVRALACAPLEEEGFANAFSTRLGGCSLMPGAGALNLAGFADDTAENIYENRRRFLRLFPGEWTLAACWQLHGADVLVVRERPRQSGVGEEEHCDALATDLPNILLGVKTADCVPVILGDAKTGACAAVHAGWRGTAASIMVRTLERMRDEYGTNSANVRAAIGPAALACCYEVGAEVLDIFRARFPYAGELLVPTRHGHARIDLHQANRRQLIDAGVAAERIHAAPLCTMCRTDLFFSYRREKPTHGRTGRLLAVIGKSRGER